MFSDLPVQIVDGAPDGRQALYAKRREGFLIINYEQLLRDLEVVRRWDPDLVVLDEAQRIKNWATKTALSVKGLTPPLSPGADRHSDGEPDRGAGLDRGMGRRHGAGAKVAAARPARDPEPTAAVKSSASATWTRSATGSITAWCAGFARRCSTSSRSRTDTRVPIDMTAAQMDEHDALEPTDRPARPDSRSSGR